MLWFSGWCPMPLPDLYHAAEIIHQAVICQAAHAADQVQNIPPAGQLPQVVPPNGNVDDLFKLLLGIGGWGGLLTYLAKFLRDGISTGIVSAFAPVTEQLTKIREDINGLVKTEFAAMRSDIKRLGRELRRIRHSPPPSAYSDDELPAISKTGKVDRGGAE